MTTPSAPYRRLATPMIDAVLRSARQGAEFPRRLTGVASNPTDALRPPPVASFASIAGRARMRPLMAGGNPAINANGEGSRTFVEIDELQPIRMQEHHLDEGVAPATSRIRKRRHQRQVSYKCQRAKELREDAINATVKALWKTSLIRKLKDNMWNEKLEAHFAWERVDKLERKAKKDEKLASQEQETRATQMARTSTELAQDARKVANKYESEIKSSERLLEVAQAAHDVADRVAARLRDKADRAEASALKAVEETQPGRDAAPLPVATRVGEVEGISSHDDTDSDDQEEPKAKRARR